MLTRSNWLIRTLAPLVLLAGGISCSSETSGPEPAVAGVGPDIICTAQADNTLTITGTGFSPAVVDGLTDGKRVVMPRVFLIGSGGEVEVPPEGVSLPAGDTSGEALEVIIPQGLVGPTTDDQPEAVYDIRVENPNGNSARLDDALTVVPPPRLVAVDPAFGAQGSTVTVDLTGTGFRDGMTVTLDADPALDGTDVTITSTTEASATFDLTNVAAGVYSITVENADGCRFTLESAFQVIIPVAFNLTGIEPPFGYQEVRTTVTIKSDGGFVSTPRVEMKKSDGTGDVIKLENVAFVDENTLTAVVPALPNATFGDAVLGLYDVTVLNPPSDAGVATLEEAFEVVSMPVPRIFAVSPSRVAPGTPTTVTVFGENFRNDVQVDLIGEDGNVVSNGTFGPLSTVNGAGTELTVTIPANANDIPIGGYILRVTNLDQGTYGSYATFVIGESGPSGNTSDFVAESLLVQGRRMLAGAKARDSDGNTFLYAIGGDTGSGGSALASVEVTQVSAFGDLGEWSDSTNSLVTSRGGAQAVVVPVFDDTLSEFFPVKSYIYVLGGSSDLGTTVLNTIERAVVLSPDDAPQNVQASASLDSGTLAAGTWYYKVSAVLGENDDNPNGETLPSSEAIITIGPGTGAIDLTWDAVDGAVSYNVYRTESVNGVSQQELLLGNADTASFTDTGAAVGTQRPLAPGSPGVWVDLSTLDTPITLETARYGHGATLLADPIGDPYIYVLGGKGSGGDADYLSSVEVAAVNDDGTIATFSSTGTSPLENTDDNPLARAFFSLAAQTIDNVASSPGPRVLIYGGVIAGNGGGGTVTNLLQSSDIAEGGANGAWVEQENGGTLLAGLAGALGLIAAEKLYILGGAAGATNTTFSLIQDSGSDVGFYPNGSMLGTPGDVDGPAQDTGTGNIGGARALGAGVSHSGYLYYYGGTSDGSNALDTTVQALTANAP